MSYYNRPMGDYRTGGYGYPMGDPGLFGFLGKVIKKAAPVLGRFFGPVGAIAGAVIGGVEAGKMMVPTPAAYGAHGVPAPPTSMPGAGLMVAQGLGAAAAGFVGAQQAAGACAAGYHPRKDKRLPFKCVRNRRMNIANPRALRRGMRRVKGFEKLARRTISFTKRVRIKS